MIEIEIAKGRKICQITRRSKKNPKGGGGQAKYI